MPTLRLSTGVRVPYLVQGPADGTPVVLLHAWGDGPGFFRPLLPLLPSPWRVLVPTQRGHGDADKPATGYALEDVSEDVPAFLDALGIPAAVLVGHSSGGYVAQRCAVDHPERVRALVLVGTPVSLLGRRPPFQAAIDALEDPIDLSTVRALLGAIPVHRELAAAFVDDMVAESASIPARVWRDALAGLTAAAPPTETGTITAPTLVVWGAQDELLPRADQEALVRAVPGARLVVYDGCGHLVAWDQPEQLARDLTGFVQELPT